jgi:hypothetical protein
LQDAISKITRAKCTGDLAEAVECLFCQHESLNSLSPPTTTVKKFESYLEGCCFLGEKIFLVHFSIFLFGLLIATSIVP